MIDSGRLYARLGARVKRLRETQGPKKLSQGELAAILGLTRTSVTNIERGQQKMTIDTVFRLCEHFKIEVGELLPAVADVQAGHKSQVVVGGHSQDVPQKVARLIDSVRTGGL